MNFACQYVATDLTHSDRAVMSSVVRSIGSSPLDFRWFIGSIAPTSTLTLLAGTANPQLYLAAAL